MNPLSVRGASIGVAVLLTAATPLHAQSAVPCAVLSVEQLKASYLACDQVMSRQRVALPVAQHCATVGVALQHCAFDGDFDRLIAWWRRERTAAEFDQTPLEDERSTHSARRRHH